MYARVAAPQHPGDVEAFHSDQPVAVAQSQRDLVTVLVPDVPVA